MVELTLPFPPSVNTYWRNITIKGRARTLISKKGREYSESVKALCCGVPAFLADERLSVSVHIYPPDRRKRDLDNSLKSLFDAITKAGVWADDEQVDVIHVYRREIEKGGKAKIIICPIEKID